MVQSVYGDLGQANLPYPKLAQGTTVLINQGFNPASNPFPSTITFQKDPRSAVIESGISYNQPRAINLDKIDEQLELSRKMFPN